MQKNYRGIIVVDTCSLSLLNTAVENDFKGNPGRFSLRKHQDILSFLAENGYKILIPETVLFEGCGMTMEGKSTNDYFPKKNGKHADDDQHYHLIDATWIGQLLKKQKHLQARGEEPDIEIVPTSPSHPLAPKINAISEVIKTYPQPCAQAVSALVTIQKNMQGRHAGDQAALDILDTLSPQTPIFYLSEDREALDNFLKHGRNKNLPVALLNVGGLYYAVANRIHTLHRQVGLLQIAGKRFLETMVMQHSDKYPSRYTDPNKKHTISTDSCQTAEEFRAQSDKNDTRPFLKAMSELAATLDVLAVIAHNEAPKLSRSELLRQKFGDRYRPPSSPGPAPK